MLAEVVLPLLLVATVTGVAGALALKRPVVFRMALRNTLRRRSQALVVVAGLMVGTAIIAGSLASGDSVAWGIRQGAFDALGPVDAFVQVEGQLAFPESVWDRLQQNTTVRGSVHALSPILMERAAVTHPGSLQSEPSVTVYGFDPARDAAMGHLMLTDGSRVDGSELGRDDVYLNVDLAEKLDARPGDTVTLYYAVTPPPLVPEVVPVEGTVTASAGACVPQDASTGVGGVDDALGAAAGAAPCEHATTATFDVPVKPGAKRATALLFWGGPGGEAVDLDPVLRAPDGSKWVNPNGTPGAPDVPAVVNATPTTRDGALPVGNWTFEVGAKGAAANQPFRGAVLVFYEVYDLARLRNMTDALRESGFEDSPFAGMAGGGPGGGGGGATPRAANFTVKGLVENEGKGDFFLSTPVFMRLDRAQALYEREDKVNMISVSVDGDDATGLARSSEVARTLEDALAAIAADDPDDAAVQQLTVREVKKGWVDAAEEAGTFFKQFLTTIGSFTIVAGVMLIVNIFIMLAEERKSELGMARAVGLTRRQLLLLFGFEGLAYALVASAVGVVLGLALSWVLIRGFNSLVQQNPDALVDFPFHVEPASLAWAFAAGFLITAVTVALASHKVSKLNVVRAIRRIEEPPKRPGRLHLATGAALTLTGLAGSAGGVVTGNLPLLVLGPCLGLIGLGMVLARWFPERVAYPVTGATAAAYCAWTLFSLPNPDGLLNQLMGPARGVIIVIAVVLVVVNLRWLVPALKRALWRVRAIAPAVAPGVAYPLEKKTRTGLTVAMFALVILVVVAFSIFGATFQVDLRTQSGGYDVEAESTVPVMDLEAYWRERGDKALEDPFTGVAHYDALVFGRAFGGDLVRINGEDVNYQGPPVDYVYSYDAAFAGRNEYGFESVLPAYATPADAYRAVLEDPSLVIVSSAYTFDESGQPGRFKAGDTLTMNTTSGTVDFTIIGVQKQFYLGGVWVHPDVLNANFQGLRGEYLFKLDDPAAAAEAAKRIEAAFTDLGMDAVSIEEEAARQAEQARQFNSLFQLFLMFGLVVGIASLGIVTARSVIERRQEIGMLRAIGYPRRQVLSIFLIEVLFTTTLGVLIGSAIAVLLSYGVVTSTKGIESLGVTYTIPWGDILVILGLTYVAVVACTFVPARNASRTAPAEAVRYVE